MPKEDNLKVSQDFYVNEATLELLRRKIESQVRKNFLQSIGLPIGGAGVVAIVLSVVVWIPMKVSPIVEKFVKDAKGQEVVQNAVYGSTVRYLQDDPKGSESVRDQVKKSTMSYLVDPKGQKMVQQLVAKTTQARLESEVARYFETDKGHQLLSEQLRQSAAAYFGAEAGTKQLNRLIQDQLKSDEIIRSIDDAIRRFTDELKKGETVAAYMGKVVAKPVPVTQVPKGSPDMLYRFLESSEAEEIKKAEESEKREKPLVLTFNYALRPQWLYDDNLVRTYINELTKYFEQQFGYCLILDKHDRFLGILSVDDVRPRIVEFCGILNKPPDKFTVDDIKRSLTKLSRRPAYSVSDDSNVWKALNETRGLRSDQIDQELPVLSASRKFLGFTSRRRLISGLFEPVWGSEKETLWTPDEG